MAGNITFTMIKPDAVADNKTGHIIKMITDAGFRIMAMKQTRLSDSAARKFYEIHKDRPFYNELVAFMTSGPIVPMVLEKENAVEDFRKLIGNTDPSKADAGTIRKLFAKNIQNNAIHGADSDENAQREAFFHFSGQEIFSKKGECIG